MFKGLCMILGGFLLAVVVMVLIGVAAFIPTGLWYCFDDAFATAVETPGLGTVPFWNVFAFTWFVMAVCKGFSSSKSKSED